MSWVGDAGSVAQDSSEDNDAEDPAFIKNVFLIV